MAIAGLIAAATPTLARSVRRWLYRLGGIGFIPLGLLDSSVIPLPGSMDVLTIILSARNPELWLYYAAMATAGSVIGGFVTYRLARKGGTAALARWITAGALAKGNELFERWGFSAICIPAMLPPPVPMVPFVLAAGSMHYSAKKFLASLTLGRITRYTLLAFLGARYGRRMRGLISLHGHPVALGVLGLVVTTTVIIFFVLVTKYQRPARTLPS
jgi:membrane protein YqaA with SNARE-associated domain